MVLPARKRQECSERRDGWVAGRWLPHFAIFALVAAVYLFGFLEFLELRLDGRTFLAARAGGEGATCRRRNRPEEPAGVADLALAQIGPRPAHRAAAGGRRQVHRTFDVDFGSPSDPDGDRAFAEVLAATGPKVVLPVFQQFTTSVDGSTAVYLSVPLEQFAEHTSLASINVLQDSDGLIRRMSVVEPWGDAFGPPH